MLPVRAELDEKEEFPWEIVKVSAEAGLMGVSMPEEYGGFGGGILEYCLAVEELSRVCLGIADQCGRERFGRYAHPAFWKP